MLWSLRGDTPRQAPLALHHALLLLSSTIWQQPDHLTYPTYPYPCRIQTAWPPSAYGSPTSASEVLLLCPLPRAYPEPTPSLDRAANLRLEPTNAATLGQPGS